MHGNFTPVGEKSIDKSPHADIMKDKIKHEKETSHEEI
jgi:hypothetical protein